jgi:hypothetical protein
VNFSEITCDFWFSIYGCFPKKNLTNENYRNHLCKNKNLLRDAKSEIENGTDSEKFFVKSDFLRNSAISGL